MKLFTKQFWLSALSLAITTGVAGFLASWGNGSSLTLTTLKVGGIAFGVGFVSSIARSIVSVNAVTTAVKTGKVSVTNQ